MKERIAKALFDELEAICCGENVEYRDDYSGRGMYGEMTDAITGDFSELDVARAWANVVRNDDSFEPDELDYRVDSMGLGIVIY